MALAILVLVFGIAVFLGLTLRRARQRRAAHDDTDTTSASEGMSGAVGFLGGSAAFLLGVLMLSSLDHYDVTKDVVAQEALAYSAAFDSTAGLAPADRANVQRDLVCLMRSVATNSWAASQEHDFTGSENTHAWRARAFDHANAITPKTRVQENSLDSLQSELINASRTGQQRLLAADSDLPLALWILVYVSIFVLTVMLTSLLINYPIRLLGVAVLAGVFVLSGAVLWTLTVFAEPFTQGDGVYISPRALDATIVRLQGTYPAADWSQCQTLAGS